MKLSRLGLRDQLGGVIEEGGGWENYRAVPCRRTPISPRDVSVDVIAGTTQQCENASQRQLFAEALINSKKDKQEHDAVYAFVMDKLGQMCASIEDHESCDVLALAHVQHLHRSVTGCLNTGMSDFDVLDGLHPTPAVAGAPTQEALALIRENEAFNRGWYAGAVGMMGVDQTEFLVGIRSCLVRDRVVYVFTGAGIVSGSLADREWGELSGKAANYVSVFQG